MTTTRAPGRTPGSLPYLRSQLALDTHARGDVTLDADDPDRLAVRAVDARQDDLADELLAGPPPDARPVGHPPPPRADGQGQGPGARCARALADDRRIEQLGIS